jgi:hypothetical protein
MKRIQSHPGTLVLRHTAATQTVIDTLAPLGRDARLLCFGSSWGAEVVPFALALPDATIVAAEIDPVALGHANALFADFANVTVLDSVWDDIAAQGPYTAICCNAVLCKYPAARDLDDLSGTFAFSEFEDTLGHLDAHLRPGGMMMIYNTNYSPRDSSIFDTYVPHYLPPSPSYFLMDNFVCQFDRAGHKLVHATVTGPVFALELSGRLGDTVTQADRTALIRRLNEGLFVKAPSPAQATRLQDAAARFDTPLQAFGTTAMIDLNKVYNVKKTHKDGYRLLPIVRRVGLKPQQAGFDFSLWWDDQLIAVPS